MIASTSSDASRGRAVGRALVFALAVLFVGAVGARSAHASPPASDPCAPRVDLDHTTARARECLSDTIKDPKGAPMAVRSNTRAAVDGAVASARDLARDHGVTVGGIVVALVVATRARARLADRRRAPIARARRPRHALARAPVEVATDACLDDARRPSSATLRSPERDGLTGLDDAAALRRDLERFDAVGARYAVLVVDIDDLRRINDLFGRPTGDRCVEIFARALREACTEGDRVFRNDLAEVAIVMPGAGVLAAATVARGGRGRFAAMTRDAGIQLTASAGVAAFPDHGGDGVEVLRSATIALRQAKLDGRDRIGLARSDERASGTYAKSASPANDVGSPRASSSSDADETLPKVLGF